MNICRFKKKTKIDIIEFYFILLTLRASAPGIVNVICKLHSTFFPQKPPTFGMLDAQNCKFFYNLATMPFYM